MTESAAITFNIYIYIRIIYESNPSIRRVLLRLLSFFKQKNAKVFDKHPNPVVLVFIG